MRSDVKEGTGGSPALLTYADYADSTDCKGHWGGSSFFLLILPKKRVSPFVSVFRLTGRISMESPLLMKNCGSRCAGLLLCAVLFVFPLLCTVLVQGQERTDAVTSDSYPDFTPLPLTQQLQQIIESPAVEVQPLREVCGDILDDINNVITHIVHHPSEPCSELQRLEESVKKLETLQMSWAVTSSADPDSQEFLPSAVALEEITLALKRRIFVWKSFLRVEAAEATPLTVLYDRSFDDINRLRERTLAVEQYFVRSRRVVDRQTGQTWGDYLETQSWLTELEACQQDAQPIRRVSLSSPFLPVEVLKTLGNRANKTILRLESPNLIAEQRAFLAHPAVHAWKKELQSWAVDIVVPIHALWLLERYEATGGMSDMKSFSQFIDQLTESKTMEYRQFGDALRRQYGMANIRFFLSSALLNNHLPPPASEIAAFRDVIQSQPTVGRRQTDSAFVVSFIPHPTRLLLSLDVGVDLVTFSRTDASITQLYNAGQTLVVARKAIELTERGFLAEPSEAEIVEHRMRLVRMNTDFDGMPLLSGIARNAVFSQYESRVQLANAETRQKIRRTVRGQVDRETEKRLQPINEQIRTLSQYMNEGFGLHIDKRESQTNENWLVSSWGIHSRDSLMGSTPAPETLPGSFADLKIHESLPNLLIGRFEFEGKRGTVGEFKEILAEKFRQPILAEPGENDEVEVTFASYNPVVIRFVDGQIELTISIAALRLLRQTHRNFQVIVRYKPAYDSEGRLVLERNGYISLINVREQLLMRAVFGKIFPVSRPFPLMPKVLEEDPQFDYLTTDHCRIEKGWFALALVEKQE